MIMTLPPAFAGAPTANEPGRNPTKKYDSSDEVSASSSDGSNSEIDEISAPVSGRGTGRVSKMTLESFHVCAMRMRIVNKFNVY